MRRWPWTRTLHSVGGDAESAVLSGAIPRVLHTCTQPRCVSRLCCTGWSGLRWPIDLHGLIGAALADYAVLLIMLCLPIMLCWPIALCLPIMLCRQIMLWVGCAVFVCL